MIDRVHRVLIVTSHAYPFSVPLFREMAKHPKLDVLVAFCSNFGAEPSLSRVLASRSPGTFLSSTAIDGLCSLLPCRTPSWVTPVGTVAFHLLPVHESKVCGRSHILSELVRTGSA